MTQKLDYGEEKKIKFRHLSSNIYLNIMFIIFLGIISFVTLYRIPLGNGTVAYGNLPSYYLYGWSTISSLKELIIYPFLLKIFSIPFGVIYAPNIVYFSLIFLPAVSLYSLMNEFSPNRIFNMLISMAFGTPLNPLFISYFLGGDFMDFIWLFFFFLSIKYIFKYKKLKKLNYVILASIFYALSSTSADVFPEGLYLTLPIIIISIIFSTSNLNFRRRIRDVAIFFGISIVLLIPIFIYTYIFAVTALSDVGTVTSINSYVESTISYEFGFYNVPTALLSGVSNPPNGFLSNIYWYLFVALILILSSYSIVTKRSDSKNKFLFLSFLIIYLIFTVIIILFHYGLINEFFLSLKILDKLDYPADYLIVQQFSLVFLSTSIFELFLKEKKPKNKFSSVVKIRLNEYVKWLPKIKNPKMSLKSVIFALIIIVILLFSSFNIANLPKMLKDDQGSPFFPAEYYLIHPLISENSDQNGNVLLLPNTEGVIQSFTAVIPSDRIWNPPQPLPLLNSSYNITFYKKIFREVSQKNISDFAYLLGKSGVRFLVVDASSSNLILIPAGATYSSETPLVVNTTVLIGSLMNNSGFSIKGRFEMVYIFEDNYFNNENNSTDIIKSANHMKTLYDFAWKDSLNQNDYSDFSRYWSTVIQTTGVEFKKSTHIL